jgi:hypothetical protein
MIVRMGCVIIGMMRLGMWVRMIVGSVPMRMFVRVDNYLTGAFTRSAVLRTDFPCAPAIRTVIAHLLIFFVHLSSILELIPALPVALNTSLCCYGLKVNTVKDV